VGSRGRVPTLQAWSTDFKPQPHEKVNKNLKRWLYSYKWKQKIQEEYQILSRPRKIVVQVQPGQKVGDSHLQQTSRMCWAHTCHPRYVGGINRRIPGAHLAPGKNETPSKKSREVKSAGGVADMICLLSKLKALSWNPSIPRKKKPKMIKYTNKKTHQCHCHLPRRYLQHTIIITYSSLSGYSVFPLMLGDTMC
jgi:hypothetical protein